MENQQQQEALVVAEQLENGFITLGKTARELRYSAAATIRRLHARVQELEAEAIKDSHRLAEANLRAAKVRAAIAAQEGGAA